jgi:hypothetical protein
MTLPDRFWQYVQRPDDADGCWVWVGYTRSGYGAFWSNGKMQYAHRLVFGPTDLLVLHRCNNKRCVRRSHLFSGTQTQNVQHASLTGRLRGVYGIQNPRARYPFSVVRAARRMRERGIALRAVARRLGVPKRTIQYWVSGQARATA